MPTDDLINAYRLFDTQAASLETSMLVRHELLLARRLAAETSLHRIQAPAAIVLIAMAGGIPALFTIMPEGWQKVTWPAVLGAVSVVILIKLCCDYIASKKDIKKINKLTPKDDGSSLQVKPWFIQSKIATYGTRLSLAAQVLKRNDLSEVRKEKFIRIQDWWIESIDYELEEAHRLKNIGYLDEDDIKSIKEWAEAAKNQD